MLSFIVFHFHILICVYSYNLVVALCFYSFLLKCKLISNVIISAVQQNDSVIHASSYICVPFHILFCYGLS